MHILNYSMQSRRLTREVSHVDILFLLLAALKVAIIYKVMCMGKSLFGAGSRKLASRF